MEPVELMLDERNELIFKLSIMGASVEKVKTRFVCETPEVTYSFNGQHDYDTMTVSIPPMAKSITEGTYVGKLEVIVDGRLITPLEFPVIYKKQTAVIAEVVRRETQSNSTVAVTAKIEKRDMRVSHVNETKTKSHQKVPQKLDNSDMLRKMIQKIMNENSES